MNYIIKSFNNLQGWRAYLACYLSGALMALAFSPFQFWPVIFISLPVFFLLLTQAKTTRRAGLRSFAFGYGYFMAGTWWIANAMLVDIAKFGWMIPFSVLGLSGALALYFLLFGLAMHQLRTVRLWANIVRFSVLWVAMEYGRSLGLFGFPWNLAGYITLTSLPVAQLGSVIGTFGLSLLIILTGLLPLFLFYSPPSNVKPENRSWYSYVKPVGLGLFLPLVLMATAYAYGTARLHMPVQMTSTSLRIVQPNIPQAIKGSRAGQAEAVRILGELSSNHGIDAAPDVTVWPETAYPFAINSGRAELIYPPSGVLITGALRTESEGKDFQIFNSIVAIDAAGTVQASYDKAQLVPFGEFVPLRSVLPLEKITPGNLDFTRGHGPETFTVSGAPAFSPLVCYEIVFPWLSANVAHRPAWLVNATNDGWYGDSPGPYQHFAMARMRAIEQGLPLVRAANSGISAVIDPYGRVIALLPLDVRGALNTTLPAPLTPSFYSKNGEALTVLLLVFLFLFTLIPFRLRKK